MTQRMPLPLTVSCFSKIQIGFSFLVPAQPGSPGKGPLNGCVSVYLLPFSRKEMNGGAKGTQWGGLGRLGGTQVYGNATVR